MNRGQGLCSNDEEKNKISQVLVNELIDKGLIEPDKSVEATSVILGSKIKTLIEFSRSVHAEMHAIITGSKLAGEKMNGGKLYCTTYPCHSCARHIVASGITEVYFIEPYRKSLATKLHGDSITESEVENSKVKLLPFDGVAPTRYLELFRMGPDSRKNSSGKKMKRDPKTAQPIYEVPLEAVPALEGIVTNSLKAKKLIEA